MEFLDDIIRSIQSHISTHICLAPDDIKVIKRNRNLKIGDFLVPVSALAAKSSPTPATTDPSTTVLAPPQKLDSQSQTLSQSSVATASSRLGEASMMREQAAPPTGSVGWTERLASLSWPGGNEFVKESSVDADGSLLVKLDKKHVFHKVLTSASQTTHWFPSSRTDTDEGRRRITLCHGISDAEKNEEMTVTNLRSLLLLDHIAELLQVVGYKVEYHHGHIPTSWQTFCHDFNINAMSDQPQTSSHQSSEKGEQLEQQKHFETSVTPEPTSDLRLSEDKLFLTLVTSRYAQSKGTDATQNPGDAVSCESETVSSELSSRRDCVLDLRQFIADKALRSGKGGFDKNINKVSLSKRGWLLQQLAQLINNIPPEGPPDLCLHLVSKANSFHQQQLDLIWQMTSDLCGTPIPAQVHLVHGPATARDSSTKHKVLYASEFIRERNRKMMAAFKLKYGSMVSGPNWEDTITRLTIACIKFELLSTNCPSPVKVDVADPQEAHECDDPTVTPEHRGVGVFVLYNYARLSTLLENYHKAVAEGTYPPLTSIEKVDFAVLREEDEWILLFNHIVPYWPQVRGAVGKLGQRSTTPLIHTQKLCQMLQELSRDLSSYYSRVHILVESREHLYPMMFARLHLLTTLHDIMTHAFRLLNIQPLKQL